MQIQKVLDNFIIYKKCIQTNIKDNVITLNTNTPK